MLKATDPNPTPPADVTSLADQHGASCRFDPITGDWAIFASTRNQRPDQFQRNRASTADASIDCPFCAGAEQTTPPAVWIGRPASELQEDGFKPASADQSTTLASFHCTDNQDSIQQADGQDWTVRVVPNKYPAISPLASATEPMPKPGRLFYEKRVCGGHEVIIESPRHVQSLSDLDPADFTLSFAAYRDRIRYWHDQPGIQYISLFKNAGGNAGASLAHSHSQLIATDMLPNRVETSTKRMMQYRAQTGCCLQCDLLRAELKEKTRVIAKTDDLVAFCPFASKLPMSVRITTRKHESRFEQLSDATIESIAFLVKRVIGWIDQVRPGAAYNFLIHTRPPGVADCDDAFHWALDIFPRVTLLAGFEFSSDCMINPTMPEIAAAELRDCVAAEDPRNVL